MGSGVLLNKHTEVVATLRVTKPWAGRWPLVTAPIPGALIDRLPPRLRDVKPAFQKVPRSCTYTPGVGSPVLQQKRGPGLREASVAVEWMYCMHPPCHPRVPRGCSHHLEMPWCGATSILHRPCASSCLSGQSYVGPEGLSKSGGDPSEDELHQGLRCLG